MRRAFRRIFTLPVTHNACEEYSNIFAATLDSILNHFRYLDHNGSSRYLARHSTTEKARSRHNSPYPRASNS